MGGGGFRSVKRIMHNQHVESINPIGTQELMIISDTGKLKVSVSDRYPVSDRPISTQHFIFRVLSEGLGYEEMPCLRT